MDLKLDSINSIALVIIFLIPGFVFYKVVARYIATERYDGQEKLISILAASSCLHAVGFPIFWWCVNREVHWQIGVGLAILLLIWPTLAGFAYGRLSDSRCGEWLRLKLRANPREPTAWAYFWGRRKSVIARAYLDDGLVVTGVVSSNSSASSPNTEDLYMEKTYTTDDDGNGKLDADSDGCWIPTSRLRWVEFFQPHQGDDSHVQDQADNGNGTTNRDEGNAAKDDLVGASEENQVAPGSQSEEVVCPRIPRSPPSAKT